MDVQQIKIVERMMCIYNFRDSVEWSRDILCVKMVPNSGTERAWRRRADASDAHG